jgi:hypothetical protein
MFPTSKVPLLDELFVGGRVRGVGFSNHWKIRPAGSKHWKRGRDAASTISEHPLFASIRVH